MTPKAEERGRAPLLVRLVGTLWMRGHASQQLNFAVTDLWLGIVRLGSAFAALQICVASLNPKEQTLQMGQMGQMEGPVECQRLLEVI